MIKKGIQVEVICGKDKGKKGEVIEILKKEHLDTDNKLTTEQWNTFVEKNSDGFAESCSGVGQELFSDFISEVKL